MNNKEVRVLLTGAKGLLGSYIVEVLEDAKIVYFAFDKNTLDISDFDSVQSTIEPFVITHIINCAAYTNVAKAEIEKDLCFKVNVIGVQNLVKVSNTMNIEIIQISTDYVFDGMSEDGIYHTYSNKNPLNYYGMTKSLAEDYIINNAFAWKIIRTSWLFGHSNNNFVNKILIKSYHNEPIHINDLEVGTPTFGLDLATSIINNLHLKSGIYHITNSGSTTRYQYAKKILDLTTKDSPNVDNVLSNNVIRPRKVILSNTLELEMRHWTLALKDYLSDWKRLIITIM